MPVVDVKNLEGKTVGQMTLADDVFAAPVPRTKNVDDDDIPAAHTELVHTRG
jgi:hypothetical protein